WLKLLSVPIALGFYAYFKRSSDHESALVPMVHLLTFLGFTLYALILIRSQLNPMINENDPSSLARLKSYLSREQYGTDNMIAAMFNRRGPFWEYQIKKMYLRYFDWNFIGIARDIYSGEKDFSGNGVWRYWGLPFFVGLYGAYHHFIKDRKRAFANLVLFLMTGLAIVLYVNQDDPQPRERDYSYTGSFFAFAIWIGIGAVGIIEMILGWVKNPKLSPAVASITVAAMLLVIPGRMLAVNYHENDRKNNYVAWDYSHNILQSCEPNGILFTNGDNDTFPLWYLQEVENVRRDVAVVNLSLVNTGWYIKQMRDKFKVPISFDDSFIDMYVDAVTEDALMARYWPPNRRRITINSPDGPLSWEVPAAFYIPTEQNQKDRSPNFIRVQDMMIIDIMRTNVNRDGTWKRPIYFAATVSNSSMAGLANFAMMEGLAFKIYPKPRNMRINPEKMYQKMLVEFKDHYRHLDDPLVYYNENENRLLQNYRSCFLQLAFHYYEQIQTPEERKAVSNIPAAEWERRFNELPNREKTLYVLDFMGKIIPEDVIPLDAPELVLQMGKIYHELGRPEELEKRLNKLQSVENPTTENLLMLGAAYEQFLQKPAEAKKIFDRVIGASPTAEGLYNAGEILYRSGLDSVSARMFVQAARMGGLPQDKMTRVGSYLVQMGHYNEAESILLPAYQANPEDGTLLGSLIAVYERSNQPTKVEGLLDSWVKRHPTDTGAKQRLDDVRAQLGKSVTAKKTDTKKSGGVGIKPAGKKK
ncbi:MAG: tetratricopeptide repeat protein, partial [bacterium]|nr:tetratricopeptide repeat protein [bacterium]